MKIRHVVAPVLLALSLSASAATLALKDFPEAEKKLADSVDPWGLTFADQMVRFQSCFATTSSPEFVVGVTHSLVKVFENKYWFRGDIISPLVPQPVLKPLWGVTDSTVSFQLAVLPRTGAEAAAYTVQLKTDGGAATTVWREEYVNAGQACYPRLESEYWPDPLVRTNRCELSGVAGGVFLCEVAVPARFKGDRLTCSVDVTKVDGQKVTFQVPVEVVALEIRPKDFPLVAWYGQGKLSDEQFRGMCVMLLSNHFQPLVSGEYGKLWKTNAPQPFVELIEFLMKNGQTVFDLPASPHPKMYQLLKEKGWLPKFISKGAGDEPDGATFAKSDIPYTQEMRKKMPGLRIYQATEAHARLAEGLDVIMTDLSSAKYDPRTFVCPAGVELWHYYCHLPINWQMRAPLVQAPNMEIDNDALQHRLALWMSWRYGAKGVLIWSGNSEWSGLGDDFWAKKELPKKENAGYPYGGIHHGNGFLVYPPRTPGGEVLPSLRLKILRDGLEDIAIFEAARKKCGKPAEEWVNPVPTVFQHPHFYDQLPDALLGKREAVLRKVREQK